MCHAQFGLETPTHPRNSRPQESWLRLDAFAAKSLILGNKFAASFQPLGIGVRSQEDGALVMVGLTSERMAMRMIVPGRTFHARETNIDTLEAPNSRRGLFVSAIRAACLLFLPVMLLAGSVAAQEPAQRDLGGLSIEDLAKVKVESVYGVSKFLQKAFDALTSVIVVIVEEI